MKLINERVLTALAIIVLISAGGLVPNYVPNYRVQREDETLAHKDVVGDIELTPENTVILSNETDGSFCRDFSVLLKGLRLEWVTLDTAEVPESVRDKNLIIVGRLNSEYTGDMITELISVVDPQNWTTLKVQVQSVQEGGITNDKATSVYT